MAIQLFGTGDSLDKRLRYACTMSIDAAPATHLRVPGLCHEDKLLVQGYLMRRNILAYKAPPNNEGYDLICIHPDPRHVARQIRVQVKSRYQTDCDRAFPV